MQKHPSQKTPPIPMRPPKPIVPRTLVALFSAGVFVIVCYAALLTVTGPRIDPGVAAHRHALHQPLEDEGDHCILTR